MKEEIGNHNVIKIECENDYVKYKLPLSFKTTNKVWGMVGQWEEGFC